MTDAMFVIFCLFLLSFVSSRLVAASVDGTVRTNMATPYVELKDKHGNNLYFGHFGDMLIPAFPLIQDFRQHKADIREMDLKPNDVIITGFPKTGA